MDNPLKLMCILAHPDDESLGFGGALARYAAEGVATYLLTATRGEIGWFGPQDEYPGADELGQIREAELRRAADVLGIHEVQFLGYKDGELDQAEPARVIAQVADHIRRVRPDVVVTFDPYGAYGHPDHIAICQFATAAIVAAARGKQAGEALPRHQVCKLYYRVETQIELATYEEAFGELVMHIDGVERRAPSWPDWAITTRIETIAYWQQIWAAVACHRTQLPGYEALRQLPLERQRELWKAEAYYRVFSLVNGGRQQETDLFDGLRV